MDRNMDQYSGSLDTFLHDVVRFCAASFTTCLSPDAGKLCVPVGLSAASALLSVLSCCLLVYQRCRHRREAAGASALFFYCFIGDLCSAAGALLSRQLHIQFLMGAVAAAVDGVHFTSSCVLRLLCWNSKTERRWRMARRRRRQHLLAVCTLMILAGGLLRSGVTGSQTDRLHVGRKLLHASLQNNAEVLGYVLGLVSLVIACTSRLPALCTPCRHQSMPRASIASGLLCSLAGALYAAAMLLYDTRLSFLLRVGPWLLSAGCCVALDLLILLIHWCKWMCGTRQNPGRCSTDTERLLGNAGKEKAGARRERCEEKLPSKHTKSKSTITMTEMGRYMDVSSCPARDMCLKEVTASQKEGVGRFPARTVRVIGVDSCSSSDSSCDSTDLEWDFEEANTRWKESTAQKPIGDKFPLLEWPQSPRPPDTWSGVSQRPASGAEEGGIV